MAAALPFLPTILGAVSTIGGLFQGAKGQAQNQQLIDSQNSQFAEVQRLAGSLVSTVQRSDYEQQANKDVNASLQDVFGVMASRGMGRSTAGLTAAAQSSAGIRSQYTQKYMADRLSAIQGAGQMIQGSAQSARMGYDSNPYAGLQSGLQGLSTAAANYTSGQSNSSSNSSSVASDSSFGVKYGAPPTGLGTGSTYGRTYYGQ